MDDTARLIAGAAAAIALISLISVLVLALRLRTLRAGQRAVLGNGADVDLVSHAQRLGAAFEQLRGEVQQTAQRLDGRMGGVEQGLESAVSRTAVVRYDAYGEMSGRQSSSVALLDNRRSGVVLSAILHRDQARLYAKPLLEGRSDLELSPEEQQAISQASAGGSASEGG